MSNLGSGRYYFLFLILVFNSLNMNTAQANGLEKNFQVNSQGAATYKFGIELPPGISEVKPNLGISYNHQSGIGLLGHQWNLTGLSYITRCSQNLAQDNIILAVQLNNNDRFCMQGQRLVATSGTYGGDQTIYRTERESWTKVRSEGNCNGGPCRFVAYQKDGMIITFSKFNVNADKPALLWAVSKVSDRNGNYWSASYINDENSIYPSVITYTNNDKENVQGNKSITFHYQNAQKPKLAYTGGVKQISRKLLKQLEITYDSSLVRSYKFQYANLANEERLVDISECTDNLVCRRVSGFSYSQAVPGFDSSAAYTAPDGIFFTEKENLNFQNKGVFRDFDGDGIPDYSRASCSTDQSNCRPDIFLGTGQGFQLASYKLPGKLFLSKKDEWKSLTTGILEDINGDGLPDYIEASCGKGETCDQAIYINSRSGFVKQSYGLPHALMVLDTEEFTSQNLAMLIDVNGDNLVDFVSSYKVKDGGESNTIYLNRGNGFINTGRGLPDFVFYNSNEDMQGRSNAILEDLNGDGLPDFSNASCDQNGNNCKLTVYFNNGNDWVASQQMLPGPILEYNSETFESRAAGFLRDFNADGLVDFTKGTCRLEDGSDEDSAAESCDLRVYYNTGETFEPSDLFLPGELNLTQMKDGEATFASKTRGTLIDLNKDGFVDFVNGICRVNDSWQVDTCDRSVYLGDGIRFTRASFDMVGNLYKSRPKAFELKTDGVLQDFNGDGLPDFTHSTCEVEVPQSSSGFCRKEIFLNRYSNAGLLNRIDNRYGANLNIDYGIITQPDVYQSSGTGSYPNIDFQLPINVVKGYRIDDGNSGSYSFNFQYFNAKMNVTGRGWLGFQRIQESSVHAHLVTDRYYSQEFPILGNLDYTELKDSNGRLLKRTRFSYQTHEHLNGVYRIELSSRASDVFLNGDFDYTSEKIFSYDEFGNTIRTHDRGDIEDPRDDLFECSRFSNLPADWMIGQLGLNKITSHESSCTGDGPLEQFLSGQDIRLRKFQYDQRMNLTNESIYSNSDHKFLKTTYHHDSFGNVIRTMSPMGFAKDISYEKTNHSFVDKKLSPINQHGERLIEQRVYSPEFGVILRETDVNGNELSYSYDSFGRLLTRSGPSPDGNTVVLSSIQYELCEDRDDCQVGSVVTTRMRVNWSDDDQSEWAEKREFFDGLNRLYLTQIAAGDQGDKLVEIRKEFDEQGRLVRESLPHYLGDEVPWNQIGYDIHSAPVTNISPNGAPEEFCYALGNDVFDLNDNCAQGTNSNLSVSNISNRQVLSMGVDPRLRDNSNDLILSSLQTMNSQGQMVRQESIDGSQSNYTYDQIGQILSAKDPNGAVTTYKYDSIGNIIEINDQTRGIQTQSFDQDGRLVKQIDSKGTLTKFEYDQLNRVIKKEVMGSGDSSTESSFALYVYDNPNGTNTKGQLSSVVWKDYDERLKLWLNFQRSFSYDNFGRMAVSQFTIESPKRKLVFLGNDYLQTFTSKQAYLPSGQISELVYPDGSIAQYIYNGSLQLKAVQLVETDKNGQQTNPKTLVTYDNYDALGRWQSSLFGNGVESSKTYDTIGRIQSSKTILADESVIDNQNYFWNQANKIYKIDDALNEQDSQDFYYDARGRLISAHGTYGQKTYQYDASGNPLKLGDFKYNYKTSQPHQMASVTDEQGQNLGSFQYDAYGNMLEQPYLADYGKRPLRKWFYRYDLEHRLKEVRFGNSRTGSKISNYFNYDPMGQRIKKTSKEGRITFYVSDSYDITFVNNGHQVHTKNIMAQSEIVATVTESYDSRRTITALDKATQKMLYKHHNLDSIEGFTERLNYLANDLSSKFLDILPRMTLLLSSISLCLAILFLVFRPRRTMRLWFAYRIHRFFVTVPIIATMALSGCQQPSSPVAGAQVSTVYKGNGKEQTLIPGIRYLHKNHQMSTSLVTTTDGMLSSKTAYEPFGKIVEQASSGEDGTKHQYTGKEFDEDSGLYYFGARYYDPILGRFLNPDPAWQYHSPYVYGANDPLAGRDPDGELFWFIFIGVALGAAAGAYAGGVVANGGNLNPAQWDWSSGKTWAAIFAGAIIGGIAGGVGASMAGSGASLGAVMLTEGVFGAIEGLAIGAIAGQTGVELLTSTLFGFAAGALFAGAVGGLGKAASSAGSRLFKNSKSAATSLDQLGDLPAVNIKQLRKGSNPDKVAIIGRRMDSGPNGVGVYDAAKTLQSHPSIVGKGVSVETFSDDIAWEKFSKLIQLYRRNNGPDDMLPPSLVIRTELFKRNQEWARKLVKDGYTVFDIGNPQRIPDKSPFYNIELETLFTLPNP